MTPPPVLLVHGLASSYELNWREPGWVDLLTEAGRTIIGPDVLGHGTAPKPHDPAAYADVERRIRDVFPDEPVDAIGFSMGARVLLTIAVDEPHLFNKLVVGGIGENVFREHGDPEPLARIMVEGAGPEATDTQRAFAGFASGSGNDPEALAAFVRARRPPLTPEMVGRVTCPTLVVLAREDFAGPAQPLVDALPDVKYVELTGVDHFGTPRDFRFIDAALEFIGAQPAF